MKCSWCLQWERLSGFFLGQNQDCRQHHHICIMCTFIPFYLDIGQIWRRRIKERNEYCAECTLLISLRSWISIFQHESRTEKQSSRNSSSLNRLRQQLEYCGFMKHWIRTFNCGIRMKIHFLCVTTNHTHWMHMIHIASVLNGVYWQMASSCVRTIERQSPLQEVDVSSWISLCTQ